MTNLDRPTILSRRLAASGNSALAASALIQAAIGLEFTLSGLNKVADPDYVANFNAFVRSTPGATRGILSSLVQLLVLPQIGLFAGLIEVRSEEHTSELQSQSNLVCRLLLENK